MVKNLIFLVIVFFWGCATPRGTLTTPLDYLPKNKQTTKIPASQNLSNASAGNTKEPEKYKDTSLQLKELNYKIDKLEKLIVELNNKSVAEETKENKKQEDIAKYNINIVKVWNFVLNGERAKEVYYGLSLTGAIPNNLLSFKLMFTISENYTKSTVTEYTDTPKVLEVFLPIKSLAKIKTTNHVRDFIIMPAITMPILHYKLKFGFGSEPNIISSVELRTGIAYDIYLSYKYNEYFISILDMEEKKTALPGSISASGYLSNITSINLDLAPIHFEANLIFNTKEIKAALGLGLIW